MSVDGQRPITKAPNDCSRKMLTINNQQNFWSNIDRPMSGNWCGPNSVCGLVGTHGN